MVDALPEALSEREQEILTFLADGLSNQEIANKLFLADQTVRWYCSQLYGKLGVANRKEAVERAQALGLFAKASSSSTIQGKHNLPAQATPFVGRENELVELTTLLKDDNSRLVTILAPGGMGKTRLALEAARLQIGRFADGVVFVPLAPLGNASDIVTTIAENIGFIFHGENPPTQQLTDFLRDCSILLVLDNFEHLMDGAQLVADLIQIVPNVRLITTSRERLNLRGETVYTLRGLEFPTWETPADALQYDAVKLFMQSAHRVRADFTLQAHHLDYLARICRLTAGLPLGIELAAGWVDVLSLEQIAAEIQKGIDILETEMRDVPERQRSIRATFERTWERLTTDEQTVFMRLSEFRGGFTVAAGRAVAGASVRSLKQLVNKALLQVSPDGRHDIHELLRQFGAEKLASSNEQAEIQARHAAYFADFMVERKQDICTNRQLEALELIDPEFENVRSAWLHVVNQQQWDQLSKFLHSLWFYLDLRTRGQDGVRLFEQAVRMLQSAPATSRSEFAQAQVQARLGWFYNDTGLREKALNTCDQALHILRQYDPSEDLITALFSYGLVTTYLGQRDILFNGSQEGLRIAKSIGNKYWEGHLLIWLGLMHHLLDDHVSILPCAEGALAIFQDMGTHYGRMGAQLLMGYSKEAQGDYVAAKYWNQQALIQAEAFGHAHSIGFHNTNLGRIAYCQKNYSVARLHLRKALQIFWGAYKSLTLALPLVHIARLFANQNEVDKAAEILAILDKHSLSYLDTDEIWSALHDELKAKLEPERFAAAWARGEKRELSAVVAELLAELGDS